MFNYGNANEAQKEAISATDGLVLITAGPGTGKTFTLVKRAVYLIQECGIKPEQIMMATFTEKAAKELITRITNELAERNVSVNVNEMYIGTFHSLCLRIIKENLEFTRLKRNYRLLDTFDQKYLVFRNFHKFKNIEGIDELLSKGGSWKRSDEICTYINHLSEEMVDIEALQSDDNPGIRTLGRVLSVYQEMLEEGNLIDFSTIQTECYKLLMQNKQILEELQDKLQYLMIDEYQDTNYIQEQIVFLLGAKHHNICVVGDDDQGLYRFRGATIRNILEFPHKFENEGCKIIPLVVNYRSNSDIVDFYNEWISTTSGHKFKFSWDIYRYQKKIEPHVKSDIQSPAVVKLFSKDDEDEWHEKILGFIKELKESGKLTDYNQLAFLFSSVKHQRVTALANFLERNGINVYSPRSDMFFKRDEIKLALGCLMLAAFVIPFVISIHKRSKIDAAFRHFLLEPDDTNEYLLCESAPASMRPYIHELAHHLRMQEGYVNEQQLKVANYESYIENWVHEIKKPLSLMTLLLDNRKVEMSPLVHTRMLYVRDHVRQNVEQILYFSRLGAAHKDCYFEPILILETCREAVEDNLSLLEEAQFSVTYSGNDCNVISNKKGFMFILGQIISNSVKYAVKDTAPTIQFSVTDNPESGQITLSVSDNGTGIPASDLPFVFDKGFTGDAGSFLSRSTGMGLYLVQKMAKDLAIDLQITSQLSCGTTIILMFPKVQYPVRRFDDATADSYANTKEK